MEVYFLQIQNCYPSLTLCPRNSAKDNVLQQQIMPLNNWEKNKLQTVSGTLSIAPKFQRIGWSRCTSDKKKGGSIDPRIKKWNYNKMNEDIVCS